MEDFAEHHAKKHGLVWRCAECGIPITEANTWDQYGEETHLCDKCLNNLADEG